MRAFLVLTILALVLPGCTAEEMAAATSQTSTEDDLALLKKSWIGQGSTVASSLFDFRCVKAEKYLTLKFRGTSYQNCVGTFLLTDETPRRLIVSSSSGAGCTAQNGTFTVTVYENALILSDPETNRALHTFEPTLKGHPADSSEGTFDGCEYER